MADWVPGVDISNFQTLTPFRVQALKAAGIELVIVRASHERKTLIDTALAQMQMVVDAGMALHAYGWMYTTEDPAVTATRWRALYEDQPIGRFWIDCEEQEHIGGTFTNVAWLQEALSVVGEQWPTGIYTGGWWWRPYMGNSTAFANLPLWDAAYPQAPNLEPVTLYGGWERRAIHQYEDHGSLAGISPLDLDAVDPALLGEEEVVDVTDTRMAEVQRIAREELIRNIVGALEFKLPKGARLMLERGALPAAETLARGLQPGVGDGSG